MPRIPDMYSEGMQMQAMLLSCHSSNKSKLQGRTLFLSVAGVATGSALHPG